MHFIRDQRLDTHQLSGRDRAERILGFVLAVAGGCSALGLLYTGLNHAALYVGLTVTFNPTLLLPASRWRSRTLPVLGYAFAFVSRRGSLSPQPNSFEAA